MNFSTRDVFSIELVTLLFITAVWLIRLTVHLLDQRQRATRHERLNTVYFTLSYGFTVATFVLALVDQAQLEDNVRQWSMTSRSLDINHMLQTQCSVTGLWLLKASYVTLFWKHGIIMNQILKRTLVIVSVFLGLSWLAIIIYGAFFFYCLIPGAIEWWSNKLCPTGVSNTIFVFIMALITDLSIISLGFWHFWSCGKVHTAHEHWAIALLFSLAAMALAALILLFIYTVELSKIQQKDSSDAEILTVITRFQFWRWADILFTHVPYGLMNARRLYRLRNQSRIPPPEREKMQWKNFSRQRSSVSPPVRIGSEKDREPSPTQVDEESCSPHRNVGKFSVSSGSSGRSGHTLQTASDNVIYMARDSVIQVAPSEHTIAFAARDSMLPVGPRDLLFPRAAASRYSVYSRSGEGSITIPELEEPEIETS